MWVNGTMYNAHDIRTRNWHQNLVPVSGTYVMGIRWGQGRTNPFVEILSLLVIISTDIRKEHDRLRATRASLSATDYQDS